MGLQRRKDKILEAAEGEKIFVLDFDSVARQDPPRMRHEAVCQLPPVRRSVIAVGIMAERQVKFFFDTPYTAAGRTFQGEYTAECRDGKIFFQEDSYDSISFTPPSSQDPFAGSGGFTLFDVTIGVGFHWERRENQLFKGALRLEVEGDRVRIINDVDIETYLYSVISSEMSATADLELLKAHAVISRSWLLAQIMPSGASADAGRHEDVAGGEIVRWYERDAHEGFDVCADDHCQRYQGVSRVTTARVRQAVEMTRGQVLACDGRIADARFSKCCGGVSELFSSCWADEDYPYLRRVEDRSAAGFDVDIIPDLTVESNARRWIRSNPEAFCDTRDPDVLRQILNNYDQETPDFFRWRVEYTEEELSELVRRKSGIDFGTILALEPLTRGVSGRIVRLRIVGSRKTLVVGKELEIRRMLSETHLYSSAFVVDKTDGGFRFTGAGWGHGVGLCQIGAAVMASHGCDYLAILSHYYPAAIITNIY